MVGFYRTRYFVEGRVKYCAITQLEQRNARRVFPCFDRPATKATFDSALVIDENLVAISKPSLMDP